jgi:ubiquinone/menaquinone biosynthesis C-methylase UbiE
LAVAAGAQAGEAEQVSKKSGVAGGVAVHLGCGDGQVTAALADGDRFLVHGLDTDASNVKKARDNIRATGLYGKVSVAQFDGKNLPYADNTVNLLVADELGTSPRRKCCEPWSPTG